MPDLHSGDQPTIEAPDGAGTGPKTLPDRASQPLQTGATVGRYVILERVGSGGMGIVYAAYDPSLDRKVALKLLHATDEPSLGSSGGSTGGSRLLREAQAMAKLSHPNVIAVHDVGVHDDRVFMAMEFVEGQTLRAYQAGERDPVDLREKYVAAARGLHAAHERGIVHRDFKPDNVLVGNDGRVFVVDFGLARRAEEATASDERDATLDTEALERALDSAGLRRESGSLDDALTRTGAVLGTPAYMPPETYLGRPPDARSDQFSFCVALYEGLYGGHPFDAKGAAGLAYKVLEGQIAEPPPGTSVPAWIRAALVRGLQPRPSDRHPDMAALIAAVERDPRQGRRRAARLGAAIAVASLAVGAVALQRPDAATDPCADAGAPARTAWDDAARARLRERFVERDPVLGGAAFGVVDRVLQTRVAEWTDARAALCRESAHASSSRLIDEKTACLDDRLADLEATIDVLGAADEAVVRKAADVVQALPGLDACRDSDALLARVPPPSDPNVRAQVGVLRAELAEARALRRAGKMADAGEYLEARLPRAEALGYAPLVAEILDHLGHVRGKVGDLKAAAETLEAAVYTAERGADDERVAYAALELGYFEGWMNSRFEVGDRWLSLAEAKLDRLGPRPELRARLHYTRGAIATGAGDIDGAEREFLASRAVADAHFPPTHPRAISVLTALGNIAFFRADYESALASYEEARARNEALFGSLHPTLADLETNVGNVHWARKDFDAARQHYRRAMAMYDELFGANDVAILDLLSNLAAVEFDTQRYDEAERLYRRALAIVAEARGPDHVDSSVSHAGLGDIHFAREEWEDALREHREALRIRSAALGDDHPEVAGSRTSIGRVLLAQGRNREAIEQFERSLEIKLRLDQSAFGTAYTRTRIADARLRLGETEAARRQLELALEEHAGVPEPDQKAVGSTWFTLAKVELAEGDPEAARVAGERALQAYEGTGSPVTAEVRAWLAERG